MKKMIVRADDVGYSDVCNIGTFKSIEEGIVTSADIMPDAPGIVDALNHLKEMPWISIGWHSHFWCSPVLPAEKVPTLLIPGTNRFRHDLSKAEDISRDELLAECRAQMERVVSILGRAPDTSDNRPDSIYGDVHRQICKEYGIAYGFARKNTKMRGLELPSEKWAHRNILIADPQNAYAALHTDNVLEVDKYDPASYYIDDPDKLLELPDDVIVEQSWHPGYVDYFVYNEGDYGPRAKYFTVGRAIDVQALCSQRLKDWIKEKKIELINYRDALYGTREYQNHLRNIGSDLFVG